MPNTFVSNRVDTFFDFYFDRDILFGCMLAYSEKEKTPSQRDGGFLTLLYQTYYNPKIEVKSLNRVE
jgi:hypothetical protein